MAKTIGLLQAVRTLPAVLTPSRKVLHFALGDLATPEEIDASLDRLTRQSVAIFRRHLDSFALWEGSDIDLEARLGEARQEVERDFPIAAFLMQTLAPEPRIARRHYFQTGTLRYFEVSFADLETLQKELSGTPVSGDGRIVLCLPRNAEERETMVSALRSEEFPTAPGIVFGPPCGLARPARILP